MYRQLLTIISFLWIIALWGQNYNMPVDDDASDPVSISTCSGTFYDSGGSDGWYANNQDAVMTICTDGTNPDEKIILSFTSVHLSTDAGDYLNVYDGADTSAPLLMTINSTQNNTTFTVAATASNASGCLTLEFFSDSSSVWHGWEADISCFIPCQNITPSIASSPPASGGTINITNGTTVDFTGSATFSNTGDGATYIWDFGDGDTATGTNVSHTFNAGGTYTLTLTVTDYNNCSETVSLTVEVESIPISIDENTPLYTVTELVEDVLIDQQSCSEVQVIDMEYYDQGGERSIGYFSNADGSFPFSEGIIMSSGFVNGADPCYNDTSCANDSGTSSTTTDASSPELVLLAEGLSIHDVSYITFKFKSPQDHIAFRYIFASEEYEGGHSYACIYADVFAFIISGPGIPNVNTYQLHADDATTTDLDLGGKNIALIPGTIIPVSVTNIFEYFDGTTCSGGVTGLNTDLYNSNWDANYQGVIEYNGYTNAFTAEADVQPNQWYTIKLLISDALDSALDSAVFLEAKSFSLGIHLPSDMLIANGNPICGDSYDLAIDPISGSTYQWYFNGSPIAGATSNEYTVTSSYAGGLGDGTYTLEVTYSSGCTVSDDVEVEFIHLPDVSDVDPLFKCDSGGDGFETYDLDTYVTSLISGFNLNDYTFTYYLSEDDMNNQVNPVGSPFTNTTANTGNTIWAQIASIYDPNCFTSFHFDVEIGTELTYTQPDDMINCDDDGDGYYTFDLDTQTPVITSGDTELTVTYYDNSADAEAGTNALSSPYTNTTPGTQTIYFRVEDSGGCYNTGSFDLIVSPQPTAVAPATQNYCDSMDASTDNNPTDGIINNIDFTSLDGTITAGDGSLSVSYYLSLTDAQNGINALIFPYTNASSNFTVYAVVSNDQGCSNIVNFDVNVNVAPDFVQPLDLTICDNYDDGDNTNGIVQTFDLDSQTPVIIGGQTGVTVTYYQYQSLAFNGDTSTALSSPYENQMPFAQEIFFRIEDDTTGCFNIGSFFLYVTPSVPYTPPSDMEECDDDYDGITQFDLDSQTPLMTTDPNVIVTYHLTLDDAQNNVNPLASPFTNTTNPQTIYVRLEDPTQDCIAYDQFDLIVHFGPVMPSTIPPFEQCDDDNDGFYTFDLSDMNLTIQNGQTGVTVLYYDTLTAAQAHESGTEINTTYTNTTAYNQPLWVVMMDNTTHCYSQVGNFDLIVYDSPVVDWTIDPLEVCDPDSDGFEFFDLSLATDQIAGSLGNSVEVTYYETQDDAELAEYAIEDADLFEPGWQYANIDSWTQIIYARVESVGTGCYDVAPLTLIVNPTPQINFTPDDLEICDQMPSDGLTQIDLTQQEPDILGNVDAALVDITYYHNETDAWNEEFAIPNPATYINSSNPETIWVRVEYPDTNCATVVHFDIIVQSAPDITTPTALEVCDDDTDGEDNNGYYQNFILTDKDAEILNGISPTAAEVTYYLSESDAIAGTNPLSSPFENTVPNVQTIWVKVTYLNTGCFSITTLDLVVNPLPTPVVPEPVETCDEDANGFAVFDFDADLIYEIQNGETGVSITFHETYSDALNNDNALSTPYQSISSGTQIIYARDTYDDTGCFRIVPVTLIANPCPQINTPEDITVCDAEPDAYDGISTFDLNTQTAEVLGDIDPDTVTVTYHITENDALTGNAPIDTTQSFTNTTNPQTIWVRVEDIETECFSTVSFQLVVAPLPQIIVPSPLEVCDDDDDEVAAFYLEDKVNEILNGQNPNEWMVYFYLTEELADAGNPEDQLISPYYNIENPQTVWVRIENLETGCYALTTLDLRVLPVPSANMNPTPLEECDNALDGDDTNGLVQNFDLTTAIDDILNGQTGTTVVFYETQEAAQLQDSTYEIDPTLPYANTVPGGQSVWALVTDTTSSLMCSVIVELPLIVNPLPQVNDISEYLFCEDDNDDVYYAALSDMDIFLLQDPGEVDQMSITYHLDGNDAAAGINALPENFMLNESSVLWARIAYTDTECYRVVGPIDINIEQAPVANNPPEWHLCDDDTDGDDTNGLGVAFDLHEQDDIITGGAAGISVHYFSSYTDALLDTNALDNPFTNTENPQTVWARVENDVTGCASYVSFDLAVDDPPHFELQQQVPLCIGDGPTYLSPQWISDSQGMSYTWRDAEGNIIGMQEEQAVENPGIYTLEVTTPAGCTVSQNTEVIQTQESTLTEQNLGIVDFSGDNTLTIPVSATGAYGIGDYVYSLDGGEFTTQTVYTGLTGGEHTLIIRDLNGCADHILHFTIVDYMRFFTPNGDGNNDYWQLLGVNNSPGAKIRIFDRFGKLLAEIDPQGQGWDGTFNGYEMPSADYWFTIELEDGRIKKGHFSLIRR